MDAVGAYLKRNCVSFFVTSASLAFAVLLAFATSHTVLAEDEDQSLEILNDSVSSTLDDAETEFNAKIYVRNASDLSANDLGDVLEFSVVARDSDEELVEPTVTIEPRSPSISGPGLLEPYSVTPVNLKIAVSRPQKSFSGFLVISSKEEGSAVEPGTTPLELTMPVVRAGDLKGWNRFPPFYSPTHLLLTPIIIALVVVLFSYRLLGGQRPSLTSPLGAVLELDAKSWTSILTLVAALVGALAVEDVFPEERSIFTQQEVAGMSLFFGATLIFAPVIYNLFRRPAEVKPDQPEREETSITSEFTGSYGGSLGSFEGEVNLTQSGAINETETAEETVGFVVTYLVAAFLILSAVLGQLLIAGLYLAQIDETLPLWARLALSAAVIVTAVFVVLFARGMVRADCKKRTEQEKAEEEAESALRTEKDIARTAKRIKPQPKLKMP